MALPEVVGKSDKEKLVSVQHGKAARAIGVQESLSLAGAGRGLL